MTMANVRGIADLYTGQRGSVLDENDYDRAKTAATENPARKRQARANKPKINTGCNNCK